MVFEIILFLLFVGFVCFLLYKLVSLAIDFKTSSLLTGALSLLLQAKKKIQKLYKTASGYPLLKNKKIHLVAFFTMIIVFWYRNAFKMYFQGDEWFWFSMYLPYTKSLLGIFEATYKSMTEKEFLAAGPHLAPVSQFLFSLSLYFFGLKYWLFFITAIIIHIANSILLTKLVWKLVPQKRQIGIAAGIFFSLSALHQQAITWVMNHLSTGLSITFMLLALLKALESAQQKKHSTKPTILIVLYSILALLAKESSIIILPLLLIVATFLEKPNIKKIIYKISAIVALFFFFFRYILPFLFVKSNILSFSSEIFNLPLTLFRIVTYPLKIITEVFIPVNFILFLSEMITPLAYPGYGAEKDVRGINFLTFTQSAGSDTLIYLFSFVFLTIGFYLIQRSKKISIKQTLILGAAFIVLSGLPLLLISTYAPWWGYVTFIDSRHLYQPSIGAAMFFAVAIFYIKDPLSTTLNKTIKTINYLIRKYYAKTQKAKIPVIKFVLTSSKTFNLLIFIWVIIQYFVFQSTLKPLIEMGTDRRKLINTILETTKELPEKTIFFIESNSSYYGFAEFMPPFQTNFGQVLIDIFYQKEQFSDEFLNTKFLTNKGVVGQGYKEMENRGFGYFVSLSKLLQTFENKPLPVDGVFAFKWDGFKHKAEDITQEIRKRLIKFEEEKEAHLNWKKFSFPKVSLTIKIPEEAKLYEEEPTDINVIKNIFVEDPNIKFNLKVRKKTNGVGLDPNVKPLLNSEQETIGENYTYRNIQMADSSTLMTVITTKGNSMKYFFPSNIPPDMIIEFTIIDYPSDTTNYHALAEKIISFIKFPDNL